MTIDWDNLEGRAKWKAPTFSAVQIAVAQSAAKALPSVDGDPNHVALFWKPAKKYPDISQIDFGDAVQVMPSLADLRSASSNNFLNRAKIIAHCATPGQAIRSNPFTTTPILCDDGKNQIIVDGHHRLAALMLLGATTWQLWSVPKS